MQQSGNKQPGAKKRPQAVAPGTPAARAGQPDANSQSGPLPVNEGATEPAGLGWFRSAYWILAPLRLFLGVTFVYAGLQKFGDPQFFNPTAAGYIGKQIIAFSHGSPIQGLLLHVALPHAKFFGLVIALGEIAIGLGTLFGFLLRPAAFFGFLLSLMFFLSASFHVYPYFYGADIVFVFAWITLILAGPLRSGLPALDGLLVPRLLDSLSPETQPWAGRLASFFLGVGNQETQGLLQAAPDMGQPAENYQQAGMYSSSVAGYPQRVPQQLVNANSRGMTYQQRNTQQMSYKARIAAQRRSMDNRRNFLLGMLAGGLGILGITLVGSRVIHLGDDSGAGTQAGGNTTGGGTTTSPGTGTTPGSSGSSNTIAQVSAVPTNSAVNFTIPSNGDPGVLVHLNNGKFVCFDATCTHAGCPVQFDSGSSLLVCPCHGAEFDPANNASVVQGPAQTPLTSVPIKVDNATGAITLQ